MRLAIVSDIHGNLTALEAVIADLKTAGQTWVCTAVATRADLLADGWKRMSGSKLPHQHAKK